MIFPLAGFRANLVKYITKKYCWSGRAASALGVKAEETVKADPLAGYTHLDWALGAPMSNISECDWFSLASCRPLFRSNRIFEFYSGDILEASSPNLIHPLRRNLPEISWRAQQKSLEGHICAGSPERDEHIHILYKQTRVSSCLLHQILLR